MPEGDTVWRTAYTLNRVFSRTRVTGFYSSIPQVHRAARRMELVGQMVEQVYARGKHLLIRFSSGSVLHTHLRMTGSWHIYQRGNPWKRPRHSARVVMETAQAVGVLFGAPLVEILPPGGICAHPTLLELGPDLLSPGFDSMDALARLKIRGDTEIGEALVDQRVMAGVGNVYKSEVLFLCGVHPFQRVKEMDDQRLLQVICTAREVLSLNLGSGIRRTRPGASPHRLWVYGRAGRACFRCGSSIRHARQGEQARSTYWCPTCQPAGAGMTGPSEEGPSP